jgi:hypothetical protein
MAGREEKPDRLASPGAGLGEILQFLRAKFFNRPDQPPVFWTNPMTSIIKPTI